MLAALAAALAAIQLLRPASGSPPCLVLRHTARKPLSGDDIEAGLRNATATPGGRAVCIWAGTANAIQLGGREIAVRVGDWRAADVESRVDIGSHPSSPHAPLIDAGLQSRVLNVTFPNAKATLAVSGLHLTRGRAPEGGLIRAVASAAARGTLVLRSLHFSHAHATARPDSSCATWWARVTSCYGGGGAVLARGLASVALTDVSLRDADSAVSGGLLAAVNVDHMAATGIRAEHTAAAFMGGAISAFASHDLVRASWTVQNITVVDGTARGGGGGAVSYWTVGEVRHSTWGVAAAHFTNTTSFVGSGGGVSCIAVKSVLDSRWWVRDARMATATTTGSGGGVIFWVGRSTQRSHWTVGHLTVTDAWAELGGGALILWSAALADSRWVVNDVAFTNASSPDSGGGVQIEATTVSDSSWLVERATLVGAKTGHSGGGIALVSRQASNLTSAVVDVACRNVSASESGGCVAFTSVEAPASTIRVTNLHGLGAYARVGALLSVAVPSQRERGLTGEFAAPLTVTARNITGHHLTAEERGAMLNIDAGAPHMMPWRRRGPQCDSHCGACDNFTAFESKAVPYMYNIQVDIQGVDAAHVATGPEGEGGVAAVTNAVVALCRVSARHVRASANGALVAVLGYSDLTLQDVDAYNVTAHHGTVLFHKGGQCNITIDGLAVGLPDGKFTGDDLCLLRTPALVSAAVRNVSLPCPTGTFALQDGTVFSENYANLPAILRGSYLTPCGDSLPLSESRSFEYFSSSVHCRKCPEDSYTLVRFEWQGAGSSSTDSLPVRLNVSDANSKCFQCPQGASCSQGGDNVTPLPGHWGTLQDPHSSTPRLIDNFPILLFGYACQDSDCATRYDSCFGHRTGIGCGACKPGFGEVYHSAACVLEAECSDRVLVTWAMLLLGVLCVIAFYVHHSRGLDAAASGKLRSDLDEARRVHRGELRALVMVSFCLFQLEGIIRVDDANTATVLASVSDFQLIPSLFGDVRFCAWPGMTAVGKAALPGLLTALFPIFLLLAFALHTRFALSSSPIARKLVAADNFPSRSRYTIAAISIVTLSYGALASSATKIVLPLAIDGYGTRQALSGAPFATTWDFWVAAGWLFFSSLASPFFVVWGLNNLHAGTLTVGEYVTGIVFPIAVVIKHLAKRFQGDDPTCHRKETIDKSRGFYWVLTAPFTPRCWAWDAVMMGRRLAFVLATIVFNEQVRLRHFCFLLLAILSLALHLQLLPFASQRLNWLETMSLFTLCIVCISSLISSYTRFYDLEDDTLHSTCQLIASACLYVVFAATIVLLIWRWRRPPLQERAHAVASSRLSYRDILASASDSSRPSSMEMRPTLHLPLLPRGEDGGE